jgi:hypothetical protein
MQGAGYAHLGVGHGTGESRAQRAAEQAVSSPLLETTIDGAKGIIVNVCGSEDLDLMEVQTAVGFIEGKADRDVNVIFGIRMDADMQDEMRIVVVATGFPPPAETSAPRAVRAAPQPRPVSPALTAELAAMPQIDSKSAAPQAPAEQGRNPWELFGPGKQKTPSENPDLKAGDVAPFAPPPARRYEQVDQDHDQTMDMLLGKIKRKSSNG